METFPISKDDVGFLGGPGGFGHPTGIAFGTTDLDHDYPAIAVHDSAGGKISDVVESESRTQRAVFASRGASRRRLEILGLRRCYPLVPRSGRRLVAPGTGKFVPPPVGG